MVLDTSLLNTQQYKVCIKGKVSNLRKGVAPSPTPQCSSYWKGNLLVVHDYGCQLYFTYYIVSSNHSYSQIIILCFYRSEVVEYSDCIFAKQWDLDMTLSNLMVRLLFWSFREWVLHYCHYLEFHSDLE